jgi:tryptophan halogenase
MNQHVCIVGSGTSGLITALLFKSLFPNMKITVISSKEIGIIGVGEGSTEHWRQYFQAPCNINVNEMIRRCAATHKYGIKFENWTTHTPAYYHSISGDGNGPNNFNAVYSFAHFNDWLLTPSMLTHLDNDKVVDNPKSPHETTNQFHFDTFKLNMFLTDVAAGRGITFGEGKVTKIERHPENGFITAIYTDTNLKCEADFYIDASGFNRVLMSQLTDNDEFVSYRKYIPCDSAAVFPTPLDESGKIHPYTRARAMPNGWMWEIPTQERRGNGYVFASDFCSDEQAVKELSEAHGRDIEPARIIRFKSGYFKNGLLFNCAGVGLASSFVEPLEATAISTSIQQARMIASMLPTFKLGHDAQSRQYQIRYESLLENIITMISLHYISDRTDTEMWKAQQHAERPETLNVLLDLWKERMPEMWDVPQFGYELFLSPHLWHVAQGQGVLDKAIALEQLNAYLSHEPCARIFSSKKHEQARTKKIDHALLFKK